MLAKKNVFLLSTILLFWQLVGCSVPITETPIAMTFVPTEQPVSSPFANSILDPKCTNPCWNGIQVGITNYEEAKNILAERYRTQNVLVVDNNHLSWKAVSIDRITEGNIFFSDNIVSEILLYPDKQANFAVEKLFEILGEPTWVQVFQDPNNSCLGIDLVFAKKGVLATLDFDDNSKDITPSREIFYLRFLSTGLTENRNANDSILIKWEGYKDYCQR